MTNSVEEQLQSMKSFIDEELEQGLFGQEEDVKKRDDKVERTDDDFIWEGEKMDWKYVKKISDRDLIEVESKLNIILSDKLKEIILCYNNGRPQKNCFDTLK